MTNASAPQVDCLVNRFDHIEIATRDIEQREALWAKLGFARTQARENAQGRSRLLTQGQIRVLLTEGKPGSFADEYVTAHGEGVCALAYTVPSARGTLETALSRGAQVAQVATEESEDLGSTKIRTVSAAIRSFGDVRAVFVERHATVGGASVGAFDVAAPFAPGFRPSAPPASVTGLGLLSIDHLTNNVEMGKMEFWADFYRRIYGWVEARYFDIRAEQTGLNSKVLQSPDGAVKVPVNQATEAKSQVQEFIDQHRGAGVQHIALTTNDICGTVAEMKKRGFKFLEMTPNYYDEVRARFGGKIKEDLNQVRNLDVLVDGDEKGYLLQIFTENQIGPLFFEIIQRRGHNGFGEGNFKALFEAIERDQKKRGVL